MQEVYSTIGSIAFWKHICGNANTREQGCDRLYGYAKCDRKNPVIVAYSQGLQAPSALHYDPMLP